MPPQDPLHNNGNSGQKEETPSSDSRRMSSSTSLSFRLDGHRESCNHNGDAVDDEDESSLLRRPPGERERLESRRGLRESQAQAIRRKSFLVQFSEMRGPPQIALLMALLAIGLGSTIGVVPAVMGDRFARLYHGYQGDSHCSSFNSINDKPEACFLGASDAQAAASLANLINNSLTFVTASLMGSLSDEYGRKGPLLIGLIMSMTSALFLYLLQVVPTMNPWWYYSMSAATGLIPWIAVALSAINDVLPQEFRAPGIGLLFAGFLFGISLSPTLALLLERKTLSLVSFGVVVLGFILTIFVVPETLPLHVGEDAKKRRKDRDARENEKDRQREEELLRMEDQYCVSALFWRFFHGSCFCKVLRRSVTRPFQEMSILNRDSFFRMLAALAFFTGIVTAGDQVLLIYYLEDQLNFDDKDVSLMFLIIGLTGIFVQVVVMKPLNDMIGEKMVVAVAFAAGTAVNLIYGIAHHKSTIFVAITLASLSQMSFPTISAIKANNVKSSEQGRIQGALYSVKALASGVGPAAMQLVYSRTKSCHGVLLGPGTMFLAASGMFVIGIGIALALPNDKANTNPRFGGRPTNQNTNNAIVAGGETTPTMVIDDEALGEYRRLAGESEDSEDSDYGSI